MPIESFLGENNTPSWLSSKDVKIVQAPPTQNIIPEETVTWQMQNHGFLFKPVTIMFSSLNTIY